MPSSRVKVAAPRRGGGMGIEARTEGAALKPEDRNPKLEGDPKAEPRTCRHPGGAAARQIMPFSDFGLLSGFGFRPSDLQPPRPPSDLPFVKAVGLVNAPANGLKHPAHHHVVLQNPGRFGLGDPGSDADLESLTQHRGLQTLRSEERRVG